MNRLTSRRRFLGLAAVGVAGAAGIAGTALRQTDASAATTPAVVANRFVTEPGLKPPRLTVLTPPTEDAAAGLIFLGPKQKTSQAGALILDRTGEAVWSLPVSGAITIDDLTVQQYQGKPVLTWWQGTSTDGYGQGKYVLADASYRTIATVEAANGYSGDLHEFQLTAEGTALFTVYSPVRADLSSVGGPRNGWILEGVVQEVDVATGDLLFEWHTLDHVGPEESIVPLDGGSTADTAWDYFHINAIDVRNNGTLLISGRHTRTLYSVDRRTGDLIWRLGGRKSAFTMGEGTIFAYQHDARWRSGETITVFDNAAYHDGSGKVSRALRLAVDTTARTVTLVRAYPHPNGLTGISQGSVQELANGNLFVGWGHSPYISEFTADGTLAFHATIGAGSDTYRAFRFPWVGRPATPPKVVASALDSTRMNVQASWNGATEIAKWVVNSGPSTVTAARSGFETTIAVPRAGTVTVRAVDSAGTVLGATSTKGV